MIFWYQGHRSGASVFGSVGHRVLGLTNLDGSDRDRELIAKVRREGRASLINNLKRQTINKESENRARLQEQINESAASQMAYDSLERISAARLGIGRALSAAQRRVSLCQDRKY